MKKRAVFMLAAFSVLGGLWADMLRNPPCKLDEGQNSASTCEKCPADGASNGCVHIQIDLGRTSVLSGADVGAVGSAAVLAEGL